MGRGEKDGGRRGKRGEREGSVAVSAANEATALANAAKAAIEAELNKLKDLTVGWLDDIGDGIRCASTLLAPRL